jgi:imidazolonepropionase-like amidohydrolase
VPVIDASGSVVMPGIIDAHAHLGLHADTEPAPLDPPSPTTGATTGRSDLLKALEPRDPAFAEALRAGVTTVLLAPPTGGQVSGRAALLKTILCPLHQAACPERVVRDVAAVCLNAQGGAPRAAKPWELRDTLQRAKDYLQRRAAYEQTKRDWERDVKEAEAKKEIPPAEPAEVALDEDLEPFAPLFRKEVPALVHAGRMDEISSALKVIAEEFGVNVVLVDPADGHRMTGDIRRSGAAAAVGPGILSREKGVIINIADALARAGVPVLFQSSATSGSQMQRMNAAYAVRNGMDPADALRALTINPARALQVQGRLGSIEPGKDADLVILSGDPFDVTTRVQRVFVNGKEAYRAK